MLTTFKSHRIPVLLAGMMAPRNLGDDYVAAFDAIYPALARDFTVPLYSFFLDGVATEPALLQSDGLHPSASGVETIVTRILPDVVRLLETARAAKTTAGNP